MILPYIGGIRKTMEKVHTKYVGKKTKIVLITQTEYTRVVKLNFYVTDVTVKAKKYLFK